MIWNILLIASIFHKNYVCFQRSTEMHWTADINILQICIFNNIFEQRNTTLITHPQNFIHIPLAFAFLSAIIRTNSQFLRIANMQYLALLLTCLLLVSFIFPFAVVWNTDIISSDIKSCPFLSIMDITSQK